MTKLEKSRAMKCFGRLAETVELDPDPEAQALLQKEYNCKNCSSRPCCERLAAILRES